jgi:hypothetical protein
MAAPPPLTAHAARAKVETPPLTNKGLTATTVTDYLIGPHDMELVHLSPDPYGCVFDQTLNLRKWDLTKHHTGGLQFITKNGCLILASMDRSTPGT